MRALRLLGVLLLAYCLVELAACGVYSALRGEVFSFAGVSERRRAALEGAGWANPANAADTARGGWVPAESIALHPYLGYVRRRGSGGDHVVNDQGFLEKPGSPAAGEPDVATVAIVGGSFAEQHFISLDPGAFDFLAGLPRFAGRRVRLISFAMRGYKQPQQLLAVAYFLALGVPIDVVINLDGFNEVALADEIRRSHGVFPAYPYHWAPLTRIHFSPEFLRAAGEIGVRREERAELARGFERLRFGVTATVVWDLLDQRLQNRIAEASAALERSGERGEELPEFRRGSAEGPGDAEFPDWAAGVWERSSQELADLAAARGIAYFHFLQPNQYLPGSKPLSEEERGNAAVVDRYAESVAAGYPLLQQAGRRLAARGVAFSDLTPLFADASETLYVDRCCHVNARGNAIIAAEIARVVRDRLARDPRGG